MMVGGVCCDVMVGGMCCDVMVGGVWGDMVRVEEMWGGLT